MSTQEEQTVQEVDWKAKYLEMSQEMEYWRGVKMQTSHPAPESTPGPSSAGNPNPTIRTYDPNPSAYFSHIPQSSQPLSTIDLTTTQPQPPPITTSVLYGQPASSSQPLPTHSPILYPPRREILEPPTTRLPVKSPRKLTDLPVFDGNAADWPLFKKSYDKSSSIYGYDTLENHTRLLKALKGAALSKVQGLLVDCDQVDLVMERLYLHYGRPELVIAAHMRKITEHRTISEGHSTDILNYSILVENVVAY